MARAWPFEEVTEATGPSRARDPSEFVVDHAPDSCDAVVIRIGSNGVQLVLVGEDGSWERWVYTDTKAAAAAARAVGIETVHEGEFPEDLRVRMNAYRRPKSDLDHAAYQEQGRVGPVIPYPENRPRELAGSAHRDRSGPREDPT